MDLVQGRQLVKKFGDFTAVNNLDISIPAGRCFGLLGPNGAGKSTLISMIYGVTERTAGDLKVFGLDPNRDGRKIRQQLGVVTQQNYLDMEMNVLENMSLYATLMGVPHKQIKSRVSELLDFMSLGHKAQAPIRTLSGGMQRRLVFVRALLRQPKLLILDEPTTGLDPVVRHLLWDKIIELRKLGITVLLTTHYMDEAQNLCDDVVVMDQGKICAQDTPKNLIANHAPGYVAFFSSTVEIHQHLADGGHNSIIEVTREPNYTAIRAAEMGQLQVTIAKIATDPLLIRPANLEDVFLKITGRELTKNA